MAAQAAQPLVVTAPFNDVQILCFMAPHCAGETAAEKVNMAMQIMVEAIVQAQNGVGIAKMVKARQHRVLQ
jgi:hypothetical protein